MEASGQLQPSNSATFPWNMPPDTHCISGTVGPKAGLYAKIPCTGQESNHRLYSQQPSHYTDCIILTLSTCELMTLSPTTVQATSIMLYTYINNTRKYYLKTRTHYLYSVITLLANAMKIRKTIQYSTSILC
jgi:hypothetical protein